MTTLRYKPLQWILDGQRIVEANEKEFQHPLKKDILKMLANCTRVGDRNMISVIVLFNTKTWNYDCETNTIVKSNLWECLIKRSTDTNFDCSLVRILEADSVCVEETKAIQVNLDIFGRTYVYWPKQRRAVCSDLRSWLSRINIGRKHQHLLKTRSLRLEKSLQRPTEPGWK